MKEPEKNKVNDGSSQSHTDDLLDTMGNISKYAVWIKRIIYIVVAIVLIVVGISVVVNINKLHDKGWSFTDDSAEVIVDNSDYDTAMDYWEDMDYQNAEIYFKKAINTSERDLGTASPTTAAISQKFGALYLEMGRYEEAYELLNSAYVSFKNEYGESDGNSVIAKAQIAVYYIKKGDFEQGFSILNDLYDNTSYVNYKLQICQMLAQCNVEMGKYDKALEWYDLLGKLYYDFDINNLSRVNLLNDYGVFMLTIGNYSEAEQSLTSAVDTWDQLGLQNDTTIANVYSNLAQVYAFQNRRDDAASCSQKAMEIQKQLFGEGSIHEAMSYEALSYVYKAEGDTETQKKYLDTALKYALESVGENHMCTGLIYSDLGDYYKSENDYEQAVLFHEKALEIRKNILGIESVNTIFVYETLSEDYRLLSEYEKGIENADYAVEISERLYGRENLYSAHSYITAAWVYSDAGEDEKALSYARMALDICDRQKTNAGVTRPYSYQTTGYVYYNLKDAENSVKYYKKAITLYESLTGDNQRNIASSYVFLSDAYMIDNNVTETFAALYHAKNEIKDYPIKEMNELIENKIEKLYNSQNEDISFDEWYDTMVANMSDSREE